MLLTTVRLGPYSEGLLLCLDQGTERIITALGYWVFLSHNVISFIFQENHLPMRLPSLRNVKPSQQPALQINICPEQHTES